MTEEVLLTLTEIAKQNNVKVIKLHESAGDKYYFETDGFCSKPVGQQKTFYGYSFGIYEHKFFLLCKTLNLIT